MLTGQQAAEEEADAVQIPANSPPSWGYVPLYAADELPSVFKLLNKLADTLEEVCIVHRSLAAAYTEGLSYEVEDGRPISFHEVEAYLAACHDPVILELMAVFAHPCLAHIVGKLAPMARALRDAQQSVGVLSLTVIELS